MIILVTGAAGYIGSVVADVLVQQGYSVIALDNLSQGHQVAVNPGALLVPGDIGDRAKLEAIFSEHSIDAVVHLAGETLVEKSMSDPRAYFENNVRDGMNLLDAMLAHNVDKVVFSSTAAVYGEPRSVPIQEDDPLSPVNAYGESKWMFERLLNWYHRAYALKYVSFRYFNAAGAINGLGEHHHPESHLIPRVLQVALGQREAIEIFGMNYGTPDGTCIRDYVHVADIAQAHLLALENLDRLSARVYNLGNGDGYSVAEVIQVARQVTGHSIPVVQRPQRTGDPARLVASSERSRRELGWSPRYPQLDSIVASAWAWHRQHPNGYGDH